MQQDTGMQTFWDHLDELRGVLLRIGAAVVVLAFIAFGFKDELFSVVLAPSDSDFVTYRLLGALADVSGLSGLAPEAFSIRLINTRLAAQFIVHMQVAFYAALFMASPYVLFQLFRFVSPALYDNERHYAVRVVGWGYVLFFLGVGLGYLLIFPFTFRFLGLYTVSPEVVNAITLESYMDTFTTLLLMMGLLFEMPLLCWFFAKLHFLTASFMRHFRRHAVVLILVVCAVITPTSDAFTLLLVSVPMYLLYEMSICVVARTAVDRYPAGTEEKTN